jgi:hypothetical protein
MIYCTTKLLFCRMKLPSRKDFFRYLYDQALGHFIGFYIGLYSTNIVSKFFETRSIRNFWGLTARRTVVDKDTYSSLEWIASLLIGFIIFEVVSRNLKPVTEKLKSLYVQQIHPVVQRNGWDIKARNLFHSINHKRIAFYTMMALSIRNTLNRNSKNQ